MGWIEPGFDSPATGQSWIHIKTYTKTSCYYYYSYPFLIYSQDIIWQVAITIIHIFFLYIVKI